MNNRNSGFMNTITGGVIGVLLLALTSGLSFYSGIVFERSQVNTAVSANVNTETEVVTVEVTRVVEKIVEVEVPVAASESNSDNSAAAEDAEVEATESTDDSGDAEVSIPVVPEQDEVPPTPTPEPSGPPITNLDEETLALFYEAWNIVEENFDGNLPDQDTINYALLEAALGTLGDVNTRFSEPAVAAQSRQDMTGSFEGIGAFVNENDDGLIYIVRPMSGRPAAEAGLKANDIIVEVDGENIVGQSIDEVISKVRGPRDSVVVLGVAREGETELIEITITRARIEIPTVESELLDGDIGYIQLTQFNSVATDQITEAVQDLLNQGATSLVLDVRDNPGGFLVTAVEIADLFMPESVILFQKNNDGLERTYESETGDIGEEIPMVLLVNSGSASASELIAGAFKDTERAIIIGENSFGKGSVQNLYNLSDGSELRVTISRFYSPNDVVIDKIGISPDIEVVLPDGVLFGSEEDNQLNAAIDYLLDN
ncbi:MAG: S41 family peptidase [Anaerolineae bacterium]